MWIFRSFPQENEKNNREPPICVKLISGSLVELIPFNERVKGEAVWRAGFVVNILQIVPDGPD